MKQEDLKILQLGKFYPIRGGVEKVMYDLMLGLSARKVDCDMLCALDKGDSQIIPLNEHARLIGSPSWAKIAATMISPAMILTLRKISRNYSVIHVHHPDPMACLALYCSGYKGKVVLHWHSDIQKQKMLLRFYKPLQNWLLKRADKIVGTTPVYLQKSPYLKEVQEKTVCLPIGVEAMKPSPEAVESILQRYQGKNIVFSLGRLVTYKGYRYLIEAARYLDDRYVILIGGTGELKDELENEIATLGVQDKVKLLGRISDEDLPAYYGACKVFCLSSIQKTEAFGIVQIEAMSCSKPLIATRIPQSGVSWVNAHGESGLNVAPENARELAEAIQTLTHDENTYRKYAENAGKRFQNLFTQKKMIDQCLKIYESL